VNQRRAGSVIVQMRQRWSDPWQVIPYRDVECDEITWSCAPSMPAASLVWHYGSLARRGGPFELIAKQTGVHRFFVRLTAQMELNEATAIWTTKFWHGVLEIVNDEVGGSVYQKREDGSTRLIQSGEQQLVAYGLERILQEHFVIASWWRNSGEMVKKIERGLTFNDRGLKNRNSELWGPKNTYVFANRREEAEYWSTRQIVKYLLRYQTPFNAAGVAKPEFDIAFNSDQALPDWDKPEIVTHGATTYELLEQLIPRERLLGWYLDVDDFRSRRAEHLHLCADDDPDRLAAGAVRSRQHTAGTLDSGPGSHRARRGEGDRDQPVRSNHRARGASPQRLHVVARRWLSRSRLDR
jgi:hypothetical protein